MLGKLLLRGFFVLAAAECFSLLDGLCTTRNVTVTGQLGCGDRAVKNVEVEMREHDILDPDDSLNKTHSDNEGRFEIYGQECEVGNIEPYLRITHNCEDGALNKVFFKKFIHLKNEENSLRISSQLLFHPSYMKILITIYITYIKKYVY
ncbi:unnamed protein product [Gongylonema pulchrum]|uniref:Transthyretin-like family protein n=1 Tax=Gongylonema pulchrum TaxID=637853 RepID=A0A183ESS5_9BILA|nr:unnamed protein product [Gongylonema pulchrum]